MVGDHFQRARIQLISTSAELFPVISLVNGDGPQMVEINMHREQLTLCKFLVKLRFFNRAR